MLKFSNIEFWVPIVIKKKSKWLMPSYFLEFETFDIGFGISVPKDIKMDEVAIALPKNGDHNPT